MENCLNIIFLKIKKTKICVSEIQPTKYHFPSILRQTSNSKLLCLRIYFLRLNDKNCTQHLLQASVHHLFIYCGSCCAFMPFSGKGSKTRVNLDLDKSARFDDSIVIPELIRFSNYCEEPSAARSQILQSPWVSIWIQIRSTKIPRKPNSQILYTPSN